MKVGFIGLGRMGQAMAIVSSRPGMSVAVYNRTPEKIKALGDAGAKTVGSIADVARYGDAVFTMLADDAALKDVVERERRPCAGAAERRHPHLRRHARR